MSSREDVVDDIRNEKGSSRKVVLAALKAPVRSSEHERRDAILGALVSTRAVQRYAFSLLHYLSS